MQRLSQVQFRNEFVDNFEGDTTGDLTPRQTPGKFYSTATPTPVTDPNLVACSPEMAQELEIELPCSHHNKNDVQFQDDVAILGGNLLHLL
jgi:hypothetical protein